MTKQLVWLVTGCSSGFGPAFIKAILARGDKAIATGRNVERLQGLADSGAATLQLDVNAPAAEIHSKVNEAIKIYGRVDVLVANAGYSQYGPVEELPEDLFLASLRTNLLGNLHLLQAITPFWRRQESGFLVLNSSMEAFWNDQFPGFGAYAASKAAVDRLVQLYRLETASLGYIKTLTINPGLTKTNITNPDAINFADPELPAEQNKRGEPTQYRWLHDMFADLAPKLHGNEPGDPAKIAEVVVDVVRGEGVAEGKQEIPAFLPFGKDAVKMARKHAEGLLKVCEEWEAVVTGTDLGA